MTNKDRVRLSTSDFYNANNVEFLKSRPATMRKLIEIERGNLPHECLCCIFFCWIYGEDGKKSGGQCAAKPEIEKDKFELGKVADGCPLTEGG